MIRALTVALLLAAAPAAAQSAKPLAVGTRVSPPFAMKAADGAWQGIAIELWEHIARRIGRDYELRETSLAGMVGDVVAGELDLSIAAMSMTSGREARVDFSHPYFRTGLGGAVARRPWGGLTATMRALTSREFLATVGLFTALLFVVGALVWIAERRHNARQFEPDAEHGLASGFWWAAVTMTTVGYGDKAPVTAAGRILATLWMFAALILTAVFTAQLVTNISASTDRVSVAAPGHLARLRVGVVEEAASLAAVHAIGVRPHGYATVEQGFAHLVAGEIDIFVHDSPVLVWQASGNPHIEIADLWFDPQYYAIVLPQDGALREPINRALLEVLAGPDWTAILARYLGQDAETRLEGPAVRR
jgi:polar amino acid transport system substrate-binding protein